jgi:hypothetical protein
MKISKHFIIYFLSILSISILAISCDESTSTNSGSENSSDTNADNEEAVIVMLCNPTDQDLESRFYTHEGWSFKKKIPARSSDTLIIDAGAFKVLTKDAAGEYVTHYPISEDLSLADQYSNIALDVNPEENDSSLAFVFQANQYTKNDGGFPAMYFIDMTFDSTQIYAIGEHRWLYGDTPIESAADIQKAALASQKEGYKIVNKAFRGTMPSIIPKHTKNIGQELPKSISYQYAKGSVLRLYLVPADKQDNIGNYIFNQIAAEMFK